MNNFGCILVEGESVFCFRGKWFWLSGRKRSSCFYSPFYLYGLHNLHADFFSGKGWRNDFFVFKTQIQAIFPGQTNFQNGSCFTKWRYKFRKPALCRRLHFFRFLLKNWNVLIRFVFFEEQSLFGWQKQFRFYPKFNCIVGETNQSCLNVSGKIKATCKKFVVFLCFDYLFAKTLLIRIVQEAIKSATRSLDDSRKFCKI